MTAQHSHVNRSRLHRFDHSRIRPPVVVTLYNDKEVSVAYESDGILYHETYEIDKNSKVNLSRNNLCPDIRKKCSEWWALLCMHPSHDKPYIYTLVPVLPQQIIK